MPKLINICSPDTSLRPTHQTIEGETYADSMYQVADFLVGRAAEWHDSTETSSVDFIGHSKSGVLQIGEWEVKDEIELDPFVRECKPALVALNVTQFRLLGCETAATDLGREAIRTFASVLETAGLSIKVFGTSVPIGVGDFDKHGFKETPQGQPSRLIPRSDLARIADSGDSWRARRDSAFHLFPRRPGVQVPELLRRLTRQSLFEIGRERAKSKLRSRWDVHLLAAEPEAAAQAVHQSLILSVAQAPGLLASPDFELIIPASPAQGETAPRFHRFTFLLDSRFVRVYPVGEPDGLLLPVAGPDAIRDLLSRTEPAMLR